MMVAVRVPSRAGIAVPRVSSTAIRAAIVIVAAAAAPLVIAVASGTMAIPRDDDWAYYRIANTLLATGHIHLIGWNDMTLIGHLLWGAPFLAVFGKSPASVH